jgi:hypothetical protein
MNEAYIEKSSKRDALDILEQLGGWPVILGDKWTDNNFTWYRLTEKASILGFSSSRILTEGMTFTFARKNFLLVDFLHIQYIDFMPYWCHC